MSRKRYTPEQIIGMLREAEVSLSQGQTIGSGLPHTRRIRAELLSMVQGIRWSEDRSGQTVEGFGKGKWPIASGGL